MLGEPEEMQEKEGTRQGKTEFGNTYTNHTEEGKVNINIIAGV